MQKREQWKSELGFILAAMGSAIGLGNIWRFPYMAYENGGFAFLIPYLVSLFVVGIPLLIVEFGLGHHMKASAPIAFREVDKRFSWLGWWAVTFVMFGIVLYYSVVISWCVNYLFFSFTKSWGSNPVQYFDHSFLQLSPPPAAGHPFVLGPFIWKVVLALLLVWFLNWFITVKGIQKGIEKAVKLFMPILIGVVVILVLWSFTFQGAGRGLTFYLNPFQADWDKLADPGLWIASIGQIFFTLSLGFGIMIAYASYLPEHTNVVKGAVVTALGNSLFSIFAAMAVFSTIGFLAHTNQVPIKELENTRIIQLRTNGEASALQTLLGAGDYRKLQHGVSETEAKAMFQRAGSTLSDYAEHIEIIPLNLGGPGLIFKTYPLTLNKIPGGTFFAILFFCALVIAGLSSSISIIEAFNSAITDQFNVSRNVSTTVLCLAGFLGGLPFVTGSGLYLLDVVDHCLTQYGLVLVGILESIIVGWYFTSKRLRTHIDEAADMRISRRGDFVMRLILTGLLAMTWLALAKSGTAGTIGANVAMLAILGATFMMWLHEHWYDFDIKVIIPVLLIFILNGALVDEVNNGYGGYNRSFLAVGLAWILATLLISFFLDYAGRKKQRGSRKEG